MKHSKITSKNFVSNLNNTDDSVPVRGLHYNNLVDDFDAHIPSNGSAKFNTINPYTSGTGTTITTLKQDVIAELTSDSGVTVDGVQFHDGVVGKIASAIASSGGTGTGQLTGASQFVEIYSNSGNDIVKLPALSAALVGALIIGHTTTTGCEVRTNEYSTGIYINNVSGSTEAAIPADTTFEARAVSATQWILTSYDGVGAVAAITPDGS